MVVFDLDFTLWDCGGTWCDCTNPPYLLRDGYVSDSDGSRITLYDEVLTILDMLKKNGVKMALASRTGAPDWAMQLIELFGIGHYFDYLEIYPGNKTNHFYLIRKNSGIPFNEMIFFDDEYRNIEELQKLGVKSVHVTSGMTLALIEKYMIR